MCFAVPELLHMFRCCQWIWPLTVKQQFGWSWGQKIGCVSPKWKKSFLNPALCVFLHITKLLQEKSIAMMDFYHFFFSPINQLFCIDYHLFFWFLRSYLLFFENTKKYSIQINSFHFMCMFPIYNKYLSAFQKTMWAIKLVLNLISINPVYYDTIKLFWFRSSYILSNSVQIQNII